MPRINNAQNLKKQFWKHLAVLFLPIATIIIAAAYLTFKSEVDLDDAKLRSSEQATVYVGERAINSKIQTFITDLTYLASEDGLLTLINDELPEKYQLPPADWPVFSDIKGAYDQIRWIDTNGQERARVNFNNNNPIMVPREKLQNKSGRYYFTDTIKLKRNEFFISPLDLNMERGKIEVPKKPMIRIGMPIFNNNGDKKGIVLLNYFGENILTELKQATSTSNSNSWLINKEGYWLKGPSEELEWGFMYENPEASIPNHYPSVWQKLILSDHDQFEDKRGLWTYTTIFPLVASVKQNRPNQKAFTATGSNLSKNGFFWKLVLFRPSHDLDSSVWEKATKYSIAIFILLSAMFIGSWRLASAWGSLKKTRNKLDDLNKKLESKINERTKELIEARKQAEKKAMTDELTGLHNRRSFLMLGNVIQKQAKRNKSLFSIIMIDIDFFKKINDTYGHGIGDETIKDFSEKIKALIRESDIAGRVGGEEFCIILPETDLERALKLAEKLRLGFTEIGIPSINPIEKLTASLGVAESKQNPSLDDVISRADSALYKAKNQGRNKVVSHP
ncbi:MAG: diguanylate cyclase [Gammaproteobacteria bacterium]|nr:diguanylate cyclase [Gammaproteobacteria bacterium]